MDSTLLAEVSRTPRTTILYPWANPFQCPLVLKTLMLNSRPRLQETRPPGWDGRCGVTCRLWCTVPFNSLFLPRAVIPSASEESAFRRGRSRFLGPTKIVGPRNDVHMENMYLGQGTRWAGGDLLLARARGGAFS